MKRYFHTCCLAIGVGISIWGCGSTLQGEDNLFPIQVSQAELVGQICNMTLMISNASASTEYSLVLLQISLADVEGQIYTKSYDSSDLQSILGQVQLPPLTDLEASVGMDLSTSGLVTPPYRGSVLAIGAGSLETTQFVGEITCE